MAPFFSSRGTTLVTYAVVWGTKDREVIASDVLLSILDRSGHLTPNVSQYNGRRFCSMNQQSPGQVKFTLNPTKEVANQVFILEFVPMDALAPVVFDVVQLIMRGKNVYYVISC